MAKARAEIDLPRTVEAFDRWSAEQSERWEFIGGVPLMMAPATDNDSVIKGNIFAALKHGLRSSPYRALVDGPEVRARKMVLVSDVVVTDEAIDGRGNAVMHPILLAEIMPATGEGDSIDHKWRVYCRIQSVKHFLVVSQEDRFLMLHTRSGPSSFDETIHRDGDVELASLDVSLSIDEIYDGIDFEAEPDDA